MINEKNIFTPEKFTNKSIEEKALKECQKLSYQIVINAYLREVENTWKYLSITSDNSIHSPPSWDKNSQLILIKLPQQQHEILLSVKYQSLTLRHQFNFPIVSRARNQLQWQPLELSHFISLTMREEGHNNKLGSGELDTLVFRCLLSASNTGLFAKERLNDLEKLHDGRALSFIDSEQSLTIGHQLHPISKSREGFSKTDLLTYSPETAGKFQLHYFSIDIKHVHQDSALKDDSVSLIKKMLSDQIKTAQENDCEKRIRRIIQDQGLALIPVHPWQAGYLRHQENIKTLEDDGLLEYLGPAGSLFTATTSIRTVFNEQCPFMFKFSLNVRITNSERVNKHWELDRVIESARMMQLPIAQQIKETAPHFEIVDEPAYLSIKIHGKVIDGFSCILRDATSFVDSKRDITAVTCLAQDNPLGAKNRLYNIIKRISIKEHAPINAVALRWFDRYLSVSIESLMALFVEWGLCFEPHGQNTLLELKDGYPIRCFCRDGQGFFHRESSHQDWCTIMPNKGEATESIFPEELARERLIYYPFINQAFSMINAFGTQGLANEKELMKRLHIRLKEIDSKQKKYSFSLLEVLENEARLPCKGNLLTQLYDMDELVGDIATQSVYVGIPNIYKQSIRKEDV